MRPRRPPVLVLLLLALRALPSEAASPDLARLGEEIERARSAFDIPGLAVAVVADGRVVLLEGHGLREVGRTARVDADTLFAIASNTKAFTAAALGLLVEDGRLSWDDPARVHLPAFQMYDPYASREMTVRDLLTHRSGLGLGQGDLLYFPPSTFTRREIVEKIRHLRPATSFRGRYAYDNILYIAAGEVVAEASGGTWDDFVRARLLAPLGMRDTVTSGSALPAGGNVATPHARLDGRVQPVEPDHSPNIAAAGGIHSSARDMARWVSALLAAAVPASAPPSTPHVLSPRLVGALMSAETVIPIVDPPPPLVALRPRFLAYGLGFQLRDYRGRKLVTHTGGLSGMVSRVALVPEEGLGVVVLTNQESGGGRDAVAWRLLDAFLGAPATDWVGPYQEAARLSEKKAADTEARQEAERNAASRPSLALARYAGRYRDAWYGDVALTVEDGRLVLRFGRSPGLTGDLEHWQYDTFVARWRDPTVPAAFVTFALTPQGAVDQVKMAAVSPAADFSYDYHDLLLTPVPEAPAGAAR